MTTPERRPPDLSRGPRRHHTGPAARLAEHLGHVDRAARFQERLEQVQVARDRRERLRRRVVVGAWLAAAAIAALSGAVSGGLRGLGIGSGIGIGLVAVLGVGHLVASRLARRRGAAAWDWQAGRYRLYGDPAARVQSLDRPPDQRAQDDPIGGGFDAVFRGDERGPRRR